MIWLRLRDVIVVGLLITTMVCWLSGCSEFVANRPDPSTRPGTVSTKHPGEIQGTLAQLPAFQDSGRNTDLPNSDLETPKPIEQTEISHESIEQYALIKIEMSYSENIPRQEYYLWKPGEDNPYQLLASDNHSYWNAEWEFGREWVAFIQTSLESDNFFQMGIGVIRDHGDDYRLLVPQQFSGLSQLGWSASGKWLTFYAYDKGLSTPYSVNLNSLELFSFESYPSIRIIPSPSADEAFIAGYDENSSLNEADFWIVGLNGQEISPVPTGADWEGCTDINTLKWMEDGKSISIIPQNHTQLEACPFQIRSYDLDGQAWHTSGVLPLAHAEYSKGDFSPDEQWLAWTTFDKVSFIRLEDHSLEGEIETTYELGNDLTSLRIVSNPWIRTSSGKYLYTLLELKEIGFLEYQHRILAFDPGNLESGAQLVLDLGDEKSWIPDGGDLISITWQSIP